MLTEVILNLKKNWLELLSSTLKGTPSIIHLYTNQVERLKKLPLNIVFLLHNHLSQNFSIGFNTWIGRSLFADNSSWSTDRYFYLLQEYCRHDNTRANLMANFNIIIWLEKHYWELFNVAISVYVHHRKGTIKDTWLSLRELKNSL